MSESSESNSTMSFEPNKIPPKAFNTPDTVPPVVGKKSPAAQVRPPVLPDCADKKYPLTGLLLTFNLASLTESEVNLFSLTVLSLYRI